ncbi:MAG TPA: aldehyde dehydrogenase family protein, partial [Bacillota bacterium]|nr:aldehyde dehydrogenase family protein [Bacillota bacterium]
MAMYPYQTEPLSDFSQPAVREAYQKALNKVRATLGQVYPLIIDGKRLFVGRLSESRNPACDAELIGKVHQAGIPEAEAAMQVALRTFETWKKTAAAVRADVLFKTAAILRREKHEFSALMTLEAGKPWVEA